MPEKADGSIIISAEVDDKRAQSQLNALEKKVKKLQNSIEDMQSRRSPLVEQMQAYGAELDKAKAKLAELKYMQAQDAEVLSGKTPIGDGSEFMRAKARQSALAADIERQEQEVAKLEKTWADVSKQVGFYDEKIKSAQVEIERASEEAAEIVERTNASAQATENMAKAAKKAESGFSRILKRIKGIAASAFIFSVAYKGLSSLTSYLGKVIKTNDKFVSSLEKIKGNLLTAFQPIYEAVAPALEKMLSLIENVTRGIAQFVNVLFGKTAEESSDAAEDLYNEANGIDSIGEAAEKARKSLASFDELNILDTSENAMSGTSDVIDQIGASFEQFEKGGETWFDKFAESSFGKKFLDYWPKLKDAIGEAGEALGDIISDTAQFIADGGIGKWFDFTFNKSPLDEARRELEKLGDQAEDSRQKTNALLERLKLTQTQVNNDYNGISQIADKFFDLSQKAVLSDEEKTQLQTYKEQLVEYSPGIIGKIDSITGAWTGTKEELDAVISKQYELYMTQAMEDIAVDFFKQYTENQTRISEAEAKIKEAEETVVRLYDEYRPEAIKELEKELNFKNTLRKLAGADAIPYEDIVNDKTIRASIMTDHSDYRKYVDELYSYRKTLEQLQIAQKNLNNSIGQNEALANKVQELTKNSLKQQYIEEDEQRKKENELISGTNEFNQRIEEAFKNASAKKAGEAVGTAIGESMIDALNRIATSWEKRTGVSLKIPALATGSVIPPNREFLALVGDNRREPEVVSPLSTIRQAVSEALAISGRTGVGNTTVVLEVDGKELGRVIYPSVQGESARLGTSLTNRYQFG